MRGSMQGARGSPTNHPMPYQPNDEKRTQKQTQKNNDKMAHYDLHKFLLKKKVGTSFYNCFIC